MSFQVRKRALNHSPQWYASRRLDENSPPSRVALINADAKLLDVDDPGMTPGEKLEAYTEEWNRILSGKSGIVDASELQEVMEREGQRGFRSVELYARPPFSTISRLMEKAGLSTTDVQVFLRWKAKNDNTEKARAAKADATAAAIRAKAAKIFGKGRFSYSTKNSF